MVWCIRLCVALCADEIIATPDFNRSCFIWHQILGAKFGGVAVIKLHHGYAVEASICVQVSKCVSFGHLCCSTCSLGEHRHQCGSCHFRSVNRQRPPVLPAIRDRIRRQSLELCKTAHDLGSIGRYWFICPSGRRQHQLRRASEAVGR